MTANQIINQFNLVEHPEGGFYKETYRSKSIIANDNLASNFVGDRNVSTCIYFLLTSEKFSAFHKINQDEIWHFLHRHNFKITYDFSYMEIILLF